MMEYMVCIDGGPPPAPLFPEWWARDDCVTVTRAAAMCLAEHFKHEMPDALVTIVVG